MGKKNRQKSRGEKKKGSLFRWLIPVGAVLILVFAFSGINPFESKAKSRSFYVKGGETRPVLDPSQFSGMTRSAYAAAMKYRDTLDKVYCYCQCDQPPFNHKSLLSCFVEYHGAG